MERGSSPFYRDVASNASAINQGLRAFTLKVFNYMGCGLALTGIVAYLVASSDTLLGTLLNSGFCWLLFLAQIGICLFFGFRINNMKSSTAQMLFWTFSVLMGLSMASVFVIYTGESITSTFFVTSSMFLAMSLYGYTTGKDLTKFGSLLFMGLIGLIVASVVNIFVKSSGLSFVVSALGVLIFTGLTAWDVQKLKALYIENDSLEIADKKAIVGALNLYLDFINLFLYLLRFLGTRKD